MKAKLTALILLFFSIITILNIQAQPTENEKIDLLIKYVKNSKDIVFIRNGDEHSAKDAAKHLQRKRDWIGDDITTAREFIEKAATKSSFSGKYYTVRLKSGKTIRNADFLLQRLKEIENNKP